MPTESLVRDHETEYGLLRQQEKTRSNVADATGSHYELQFHEWLDLG